MPDGLARCRRELAHAHALWTTDHPERFGLELAMEDWLMEELMITKGSLSTEQIERLDQNPFTGKGPRTFPTGATRDTADGKPVYGKFLSPLAIRAFGEYMHRHRQQSDGSLRDGDNWKKGMPERECFESLMRHIQDLHLHMDGFGGEAREGKVDVLCAALFNVQIMLHQTILEGLCQKSC